MIGTAGEGGVATGDRRTGEDTDGLGRGGGTGGDDGDRNECCRLTVAERRCEVSGVSASLMVRLRDATSGVEAGADEECGLGGTEAAGETPWPFMD
ncbi:MAG: hypothetical protein Q8P67_02285 [archaeon]|nr:hypothetical protein [archaeon]